MYIGKNIGLSKYKSANYKLIKSTVKINLIKLNTDLII
jgi:hypothetical protein